MLRDVVNEKDMKKNEKPNRSVSKFNNKKVYFDYWPSKCSHAALLQLNDAPGPEASRCSALTPAKVEAWVRGR